MCRETLKAAKLTALQRYKEQANQDMSNAKTKRHFNNAMRRYNLCVTKEKQYQTEFWTVEMDWQYGLYKDSDDITAIPAM